MALFENMQEEKTPAIESPSLEKFDINFLADPSELEGDMAYNWRIKEVHKNTVLLERKLTDGIKKQTSITKDRLFTYNPLLKEDPDFLQALQASEEKN